MRNTVSKDPIVLKKSLFNKADIIIKPSIQAKFMILDTFIDYRNGIDGTFAGEFLQKVIRLNNVHIINEVISNNLEHVNVAKLLNNIHFGLPTTLTLETDEELLNDFEKWHYLPTGTRPINKIELKYRKNFTEELSKIEWQKDEYEENFQTYQTLDKKADMQKFFRLLGVMRQEGLTDKQEEELEALKQSGKELECFRKKFMKKIRPAYIGMRKRGYTHPDIAM